VAIAAPQPLSFRRASKAEGLPYRCGAGALAREPRPHTDPQCSIRHRLRGALSLPRSDRPKSSLPSSGKVGILTSGPDQHCHQYSRLAQAFGHAGTNDTKGALSFARFAKGGNQRPEFILSGAEGLPQVWRGRPRPRAPTSHQSSMFIHHRLHANNSAMLRAGCQTHRKYSRNIVTAGAFRICRRPTQISS
jgi:hypothetical protein